ncbi:MAG: NAD-dependent epimerase/dehydratase family protein [Cypionkella sp.]|nr:NAD-dependent epimerase/dehydratase family protein [Cypionkella sp.]
MSDTVLITGAAGFIGFHLARRMLAAGWQVIGVDGMTAYYDPKLKEARLAILQAQPGFTFHQMMIEEEGRLTALMASTSSAYGANTAMPYGETHRAAHPMSFYAATKIANEAMAHSYAHLFGLPTTMFRFFTVYGPWGRPDMALFKFTKAILQGAPIDVYNHGDMRRDFTYVDDLVEGILRLTACPPGTEPVGPMDSLSPVAPFRVVNIGNGAPVQLTDFIAAIETATGRPATRNLLPMQPGDVPATWADASLITALVGPLPRTDITEGVARFVNWYRGWNG